MGSKTKMWYVGCDRMVFAINSNLFLIKFDSFFNKWSLNLYKKTINPLIPLFNPWWSQLFSHVVHHLQGRTEEEATLIVLLRGSEQVISSGQGLTCADLQPRRKMSN